MVASQLQRYSGLRVARPAASPRIQRAVAPVRSRQTLTTRADYLGSATNLIVCGCTAACLLAGRVGLAPSANKPASAGLTLSEVPSGMRSGDPAGFTAVDVLAFGAFGHILGVGIVLGLKATGTL